ncbi:hypothetical protein K7432_012142, partial [Basidiobolus ranarum]
AVSSKLMTEQVWRSHKWRSERQMPNTISDIESSARNGIHPELDLETLPGFK